MSKELFISASPHETKVAVLEDGQLVEVYYERDTNTNLAGGIYKGRVSRVLPGMQSAFVDIGLDRDAFLYVSDFFEDAEEYEKLIEETEARLPAPEGPYPAAGRAETATTAETERTESRSPASTGTSTTEADGVEPDAACVEAAAANAEPEPRTSPEPNPELTTVKPVANQPEFRRMDQRGRRRRRPGRGYIDHQFNKRQQFRERQGPTGANQSTRGLEILPGESLAKYSHAEPDRATQDLAVGAESNLDAEEQGAAAMGTLGDSEAEVRAGFDPSESEAKAEYDLDENQQVPVNQEDTYQEEAIEVYSENDREQEIEAPPPVLRVGPGVLLEGGEETSQEGPGVALSPEEECPTELAAVPLLDSYAVTEFISPVETGLASEERKTELTFPVAALPLPEESLLAQSGSTDAAAPPEENASAMLSAEDMQVNEAPVADTIPADGSPPPAPTTTEVHEDTGKQQYTLREPHQRPRFLPRRSRRARRRMGTPRPERDQSRAANNQTVQISDLLREGQEILVQVSKEPLGAKGARITSHIALPGRYLVSMPTISHIGVSRKISSEQERYRLRNIVLENRGSLTGGFIVRTAAAGRSEEELKADLRFLSNLWNEIRTKAERVKAPALLYRDLDLVQRLLRDVFSPDFKVVRVDNEIVYEKVVDFVSRLQPSLLGNVKLYTRPTPLFEEFGIQAEIEKALKPKIWLKSGGYIVINQTEALVAIDVNTGKYVGKTNRLEDTIVKTNLEAAKEIVRQVRLRDLGGIIVIDFIDMDERRNRQKVVQALEEALHADRAPTKVLTFNDFGLVALTRKRVRQSLERTLCEPCHYCEGAGWIKSPTTICNEILEEAPKMALQVDGPVIHIRVNPEVAQVLKSRQGSLVAELETLTQKEVVIQADAAVHQERFEIF